MFDYNCLGFVVHIGEIVQVQCSLDYLSLSYGRKILEIHHLVGLHMYLFYQEQENCL